MSRMPASIFGSHRNPWWFCPGCWGTLFVLASAIVVGVVLLMEWSGA